MTAQLLLLGGTAEARRLAELLAGRADVRVVSSLAGRVSEPRLPLGEVRIGGFGGPDGLASWLRDEHVGAVIDATHPFAEQITRSAAHATAALGVPLVMLRRPGWRPEPGDDWRSVATIAAASEVLPALGRRVFLTTGRRDLAVFAGLDELWFLARCVDPPGPPLPRRLEIVLDRGPYTVDGELALMRDNRIDVLVTKDSGGDLTSAKLVAARTLGLPVVVVRRPSPPAVPTVETVEQAVAWLDNLLRDHVGDHDRDHEGSKGA